MIYKIFITADGVPASGLSPAWQSLRTLDGTEKSASAPAISEIGGGWYRFEMIHGTAPFDVAELVGVIDAGSALSNYDRYLPVTISLRDLALAKLVNPASYDLVSGVESIRNDADSVNELQIELSQETNVEYRKVRSA
jgi:hypothetical protein